MGCVNKTAKSQFEAHSLSSAPSLQMTLRSCSGLDPRPPGLLRWRASWLRHRSSLYSCSCSDTQDRCETISSGLIRSVIWNENIYWTLGFWIRSSVVQVQADESGHGATKLEPFYLHFFKSSVWSPHVNMTNVKKLCFSEVCVSARGCIPSSLWSKKIKCWIRAKSTRNNSDEIIPV